jgi:hypothetical protein
MRADPDGRSRDRALSQRNRTADARIVSQLRRHDVLVNAVSK